MITGHRGAATLAPENTLASIEAAAKAGASWVEIDTQLSADNVPVVFHDKTVNRCTNGKGKISDLDIATLKSLDAGSWFSEDFVGEAIPTLEEALDKCVELDLTLNLELKTYDDKTITDLVEQVVAVVKRKHYPIDKLLFSSFSKEALTICQSIMPDVKRGFICEVWNDASLDSIAPLDCFSVHIDHQILDASIAKQIKDAGLILKIWTLNAPEKAEKFRQLGVDYIITDMPNKF
ncbi:glycerophosphodiester phosphodiesterase family protein [Vibrio amylolyticus]|uniref:glycerophosphodiester phosphodiesterase family protein n=1 Tax=Vibrio amylolyticus TaxID=2847292 RepID=UPI003554461F